MSEQGAAELVSPKILILDDDELVLRAYKRRLERDKYPLCALAKCVDEAHEEMDSRCLLISTGFFEHGHFVNARILFLPQQEGLERIMSELSSVE